MTIAIATVMTSTSVNWDIVWSTASVIAAAPWTAVTTGIARSARLTSAPVWPAAGTTEIRLTRPVSPIVMAAGWFA